MEHLKTVLILLATLGVLVTIHEWGHFWVARRCGIKVLRFSVGFGTPLFKWSDKQGTEYVVAAIPLGGYVKMLDEREGAVAPEEVNFAFNRKSVSARLATVLAGPLVNILFAIFLYWIIFVNGITEVAPVVGRVVPESLAAQAGLQVGQEIIAVDGKSTSSWEKVSLQLVNRVGDTGDILLTVKTPNDNTQQIPVRIGDWLVGESVTDTLKSIGIEPWRLAVPAVIGRISKGERAESAGLQIGDELISANSQPLGDWMAWVDFIRANPEKPFPIVVKRQGQLLDLELKPAAKQDEAGKLIGFVGAGPRVPEIPKEMLRETHYNILTAWQPALIKTWDMSVVTIKSIGKMVQGKLSIKNLSGPITIAKVAGDSAKVGILAFIGFLAFLSLSLGVINLLPIPVLDGGHVVFYIIEGLLGRPLPEKVQEASVYVGMSLVVGLSLVAIYNDILRL
jgi:regulator of sigma E protease